MTKRGTAADLVAQYRAQERWRRWRRWDEAVAALPLVAGQQVLDLGCGLGAVTERLHRKGVDVTGIDANPLLLAAARERYPLVRFEEADLRTIDRTVDGIWASFVVAYFTDDDVVARWATCLRPGDFLALLEIDDLLGHEPICHDLDLAAFYEEARDRYDFTAGRRLAARVRAAGRTVVHEA